MSNNFQKDLIEEFESFEKSYAQQTKALLKKGQECQNNLNQMN